MHYRKQFSCSPIVTGKLLIKLQGTTLVDSDFSVVEEANKKMSLCLALQNKPYSKSWNSKLKNEIARLYSWFGWPKQYKNKQTIKLETFFSRVFSTL